MHLSGIGMRELAYLQINNDKAPQFALKEKQINPVPFATNPQPPLATYKGKIAAELEQEVLKVPQERFFKVGLGVFIFQSKEFENERVAHLFIASAETESSAEATVPLRSMAFLFRERAVRS
jgi:hypothetical protein